MRHDAHAGVKKGSKLSIYEEHYVFHLTSFFIVANAKDYQMAFCNIDLRFSLKIICQYLFYRF